MEPATPSDGTWDLRRAVERLAAHLPGEFAPLAALAYNYWWSWHPEIESLFERVARERWVQCGKNPVRLLQEVDPETLRRASEGGALLRDVHIAGQQLEAYRAARASDAAPVAYMCAEFGIHASLPFYAGGLGVLAGDLLKQASDQSLQMVGVGLFYREGSFHQHIDASGWQHEYWQATDSDRLPAAVVTTRDGGPLQVEVAVRGRPVRVRVWRVDVGASRLYLLDTDVPENTPSERWITSRLYVGNREIRLAQYAILGFGGLRALAAMGIQPRLVHLNEGHAALAALELLRERIALGDDFAAAMENVRRRVVFTTHTPVAAGNESFPAAQVSLVLPDLAEQVGVGWDQLVALGRKVPSNHDEPLGLTPLALRLSRAATAVSELHGRVAREMWRDVFAGRTEGTTIGHVTNGVHVRTWMAAEWQRLLDRFVPGWRDAPYGAPEWEAVERIPDEEIWRVRNCLRARLCALVQERSVGERLGRGEPVDYAESAVGAWRPEVLTLGFARRIATYKRLSVITSRPEAAARLLASQPGLQIVIAGRAHPQDEPAKTTVQQLFRLNDIPGVGGRGVFLEEYGLDLARPLVQGCDLWVNVPRRGREASGTSGMKSAMNGGLQLSTLDGWWAEAYQPGLGWGLPPGDAPSEEEQDRRDTDAFFDILEHEVLPAFYDRDEAGLPRRWIAMIRASLRAFVPQFSAARMLRDYSERLYSP